MICSKYNCSIWRVDVGMSSGVLDSRPEVNLIPFILIHLTQFIHQIKRSILFHAVQCLI